MKLPSFKSVLAFLAFAAMPIKVFAAGKPGLLTGHPAIITFLIIAFVLLFTIAFVGRGLINAAGAGQNSRDKTWAVSMGGLAILVSCCPVIVVWAHAALESMEPGGDVIAGLPVLSFYVLFFIGCPYYRSNDPGLLAWFPALSHN
jgi:hypothetical protein